MAHPKSKTGIWLDDDGNVVYEAPEGRSTQIVAPGGEIDGIAKARLESVGASVSFDDDGNPVAAEDEGEQPTADDAPKKASRARKSST